MDVVQASGEPAGVAVDGTAGEPRLPAPPIPRHDPVVEGEAERSLAPDGVSALLARLDAILEGVNRTRVPLSYSDYVYNLKLHIAMVRARLQQLAADRKGEARDDGAGGSEAGAVRDSRREG